MASKRVEDSSGRVLRRDSRTNCSSHSACEERSVGGRDTESRGASDRATKPRTYSPRDPAHYYTNRLSQGDPKETARRVQRDSKQDPRSLFPSGRADSRRVQGSSRGAELIRVGVARAAEQADHQSRPKSGTGGFANSICNTYSVFTLFGCIDLSHL